MNWGRVADCEENIPKWKLRRKGIKIKGREIELDVVDPDMMLGRMLTDDETIELELTNRAEKSKR